MAENNGAITREELELTERPDRLGQYVRPHLDEFVFAEFGEEYLSKSSLDPGFGEVAIPLRKEDLAGFAGGKGVTPDVLCENMVWVMGCDPHFRFAKDYRRYIQTMFASSIKDAMIDMAEDALEKDDKDSAFVHARAALILAPDDEGAMYTYVRVLNAMYENSEDTELVGRCKAESLEFLEMLTILHPDFAPGHYYLGYAYANLGLYAKAGAAWQAYLDKTTEEEGSKERREILERIAELEGPIAVEAGVNEAIAGRYEQAILKLEPFRKGRFESWWPLHYYLAVSYEGMAQSLAVAAPGRTEAERAKAAYDADDYTMKALDAYKMVLKKNPAHLPTLDALVNLYASLGDEENAYKYRRKAEIVAEGFKEDE